MFSGAIKIGSDLNDFIAPSQACVVSLEGNKIKGADLDAEVRSAGGDRPLFLNNLRATDHRSIYNAAWSVILSASTLKSAGWYGLAATPIQGFPTGGRPRCSDRPRQGFPPRLPGLQRVHYLRRNRALAAPKCRGTAIQAKGPRYRGGDHPVTAIGRITRRRFRPESRRMCRAPRHFLPRPRRCRCLRRSLESRYFAGGKCGRVCAQVPGGSSSRGV
jgi:hypothetical protein